ncbi:MAG TPA: mechanosensitive ion channel family protein [Ignavibacteria bacterium]|nr:mechanosensitive ion channel family protein [Ignavibacteria bacterium]
MEVNFFDILEKYWVHFLNILPGILISLLILIIFFFIGNKSSKLMKGRLLKRTDDALLAGFFAKILNWIILIIGFVISMEVMGLATIAGGIITGAGISAVILGFAFKNIGENFLSGLLLAFKRPFSVGDLIITSGFTGKVTSMNFRTTNMKTEDGKYVYIPNSLILNNPLTNVTREGLRRFDFTVQLDYNNDTDLAKRLISDAFSKVKDVSGDPAPIITVDQLSSFISIKIYYWIDTLKTEKSVLEIKSEIIEGTKRHLMEGGISFSEITQIKITNDTIPLKLQS